MGWGCGSLRQYGPTCSILDLFRNMEEGDGNIHCTLFLTYHQMPPLEVASALEVDFVLPHKVTIMPPLEVGGRLCSRGQYFSFRLGGSSLLTRSPSSYISMWSLLSMLRPCCLSRSSLLSVLTSCHISRSPLCHLLRSYLLPRLTFFCRLGGSSLLNRSTL